MFKRHTGTGVVVLAVALAAAVSASSAGGLGHGKDTRPGPYPMPVRDPCEPLPWTMFEATKEFENLQIHVTGPCFNILEIYFNSAHKPKDDQPDSQLNGAATLQAAPPGRTSPQAVTDSGSGDTSSTTPPTERFFVDPIDCASCLHENKSLSLAPANEWGTFAVRYGLNQDTFKIYGWAPDGDDPKTCGPYTLEHGCQVRLRWITPRIVKVTCCSSGLSQTVIARFKYDTAKKKWDWEAKLYTGQP